MSVDMNLLNQVGCNTSQPLMNGEVNSTEEKTSKICIEKNNQYFFRFPEKSVILLNTRNTVDISNIDINLSGIFIGGIGYGGGASKLLARTMKIIGDGEGVVCNLPFCMEGYEPIHYSKIELISTENRVVSASAVIDIIKNKATDGFTHFNIPINLNGHASLASIIIFDDTAILRFYDSLAPEEKSYDARYNTLLIDFIKQLLPSSMNLMDEKPEVLHLLDQGDPDSTGCGYYALYTALLLKENEYLRNLTSYHGAPLFNPTDDKKIRAELIVRSLVDCGLDNVDTRSCSLLTQSRDYLFNRIGIHVRELIAQLRPRLESCEKL
jgi:hypothetical protein